MQGCSQDFISTEAKLGKTGSLGASRQRGPGAELLVRGLGRQIPPEDGSFSVVGCPKEMENVLQLYYFTYLRLIYY